MVPMTCYSGKGKTWRQFVCVLMCCYVQLFATLWIVPHQGFPKQKWEIAISSSMGSSQPKHWTWVSCVTCIAGEPLKRWHAFPIREAHGGSQRIHGHQGLAKKVGWITKAQMTSRAMKLFCMILSWRIHVIIHWSKSHRMYNIKSSFSCSKCTSLVKNTDNAEGCVSVQAGGIWELSTWIFFETKTALKNKV